MKNNRVCFIGMSGVGKSSFGKHLSNTQNKPFIDTDTLIEKTIETSIESYIKTHSEKTFLNLEEHIILTISFSNTMILSTGGSVIYCHKAMTYLKKYCTLVYLNDSLSNIKNRTNNFDNRGIIMNGKKTIEDVYVERKKLYQKWADITVLFPENYSFLEIASLIEKKIT